MILYFVRHGEKTQTEISSEETLTKLGRKQALRIGKRLSKIKFDCVYVSNYKRTIETFLIMKPYLKFEKHFISSDYKESYGGLVGNPERPMPSEAKNKKDKEKISQRVKNDRRRLNKFWKGLLSYPYESRVLLIGHGNFFRSLIAKTLKINPTKTWQIAVDNTSLSKLGISKTRNCGIFLLNDTTHLE